MIIIIIVVVIIGEPQQTIGCLQSAWPCDCSDVVASYCGESRDSSLLRSAPKERGQSVIPALLLCYARERAS